MAENTEPVLKELAEPVNVCLHDPVAKRWVAALKNTPVTPNQVTYFSVLTGLASGCFFSRGSGAFSAAGALLLELTLVLDCVDGQLARARNMASDRGRLIDGIAGYFAYLAVVYGIISGYPRFQAALVVIAVFAVLRAVSYDYCKQTFGMTALKGFDGVENETQKTCEKIRNQPSSVLVVYFYYLQAQQLIFRGKWETLGGRLRDPENSPRAALSPGARREYLGKAGALLKLWRWNGIDLLLFLVAALGLFSMPGQSLNILACAVAAQFLATYVLHFFLVRRL